MRMRYLMSAVVLAGWSLVFGMPVAAQTPAPVFAMLEGEWRGEGRLMGRPAAFSMGWAMHEGFAVLTFRNGFADSTGQVTPVLNAAAVYRTVPDAPEAVWLDSRGVRVEIQWEATDSTLVSTWTAPTESGRTTYRVVGAGDLEVVDEVLRDGAWATFGTARYRRAHGPGREDPEHDAPR